MVYPKTFRTVFYSEGLDMLQTEERLRRQEELLSMSRETTTKVPQNVPKKGVPPGKAQGSKCGGKTQKGKKKEAAPKTRSGKDKQPIYLDITCDWCKQTGHYASDCKLPLEGSAAASPQNKTTPPKLKKPAMAPMQ